MKHVLGAIVMMALLASSAFAQSLPLMANKKHDLRFSSSASVKGASESLCGYCHTPHVPATGIKVPLWSRAKLTTTGYTAYSSSTMNSTPTALATGDENVSAMCMSCHDGTALFSPTAYVKRPYSGTVNTYNTTTTVGDASNLFNGTKYGAGLSHTHPVNFTYDAALATADGHLESTPLNNVPLFSGKMQCASCHDVHSTTSGKFIRNPGSDHSYLCVSCHQK
jgi:predicted CXXCH cytochrome family protein